MSLLEICQALQNSETGLAIHESLYFFPVIETMHVLGLSVSVGTIFWFDIRAIGIGMRRQRVSEVFASVKPWMLAGFIMMVLTGALMFWARAADAYANTFFRIKVAGMALSVVNALYFHFKTQKSIPEWDAAPTPPFGVRMAGLFSIVLWLTVIAVGRLMAYTFAI
jgi:hypothetical protein